MPCTTFEDRAMETHLTSIAEIARVERMLRESGARAQCLEDALRSKCRRFQSPSTWASERFPLVSDSGRKW